MAFYLYFLHIVFSAVQGGGGRGAIDGEQERDFGEGVHTDGREVVSSLAVCLWDIAPPSLDVSPGTVFVEHPRPCFIVSLKTSLPRLPPPPGAFRASSRPLKGAGSDWR